MQTSWANMSHEESSGLPLPSTPPGPPLSPGTLVEVLIEAENYPIESPEEADAAIGRSHAPEKAKEVTGNAPEKSEEVSRVTEVSVVLPTLQLRVAEQQCDDLRKQLEQVQQQLAQVTQERDDAWHDAWQQLREAEQERDGAHKLRIQELRAGHQEELEELQQEIEWLQGEQVQPSQETQESLGKMKQTWEAQRLGNHLPELSERQQEYAETLRLLDQQEAEMARKAEEKARKAEEKAMLELLTDEEKEKLNRDNRIKKADAKKSTLDELQRQLAEAIVADNQALVDELTPKVWKARAAYKTAERHIDNPPQKRKRTEKPTTEKPTTKKPTMGELFGNSDSDAE